MSESDWCCRHRGRPATVHWLENSLCETCERMLYDLESRHGQAYAVEFMGLRLPRGEGLPRPAADGPAESGAVEPIGAAGFVSEGEPDVYSPQKLAARLRVSESTLCTWRRSGHGPPFIQVARTVRYPVAACRAWMQAQAHSSTATPARAPAPAGAAELLPPRATAAALGRSRADARDLAVCGPSAPPVELLPTWRKLLADVGRLPAAGPPPRSSGGRRIRKHAVKTAGG